jgi:hypothetical protein
MNSMPAADRVRAGARDFPAARAAVLVSRAFASSFRRNKYKIVQGTVPPLLATSEHLRNPT